MATQATCCVSRCSAPASYQFGADADTGMLCRRHALVYWPVCGRAITVALVVGTILVAINQGDLILGGHLTPLLVARIGLTYLVPLSVSTYSALAANRLRDD